MKRIGLVLTLMLALLFLMLAGIQFVNLTRANPTFGSSPYSETPDKSPPSIKIQIPEPNKVYNPKTVPYSITIEKPSSWFENDTIHGTLRSVGYILDEKENVTIADINTSYLPDVQYLIDFQSETRTISLEGNLSGLSEGSHTIQVWVNSVSIYHPSDTPQNFYGWWAAVAEYPIETSSDVTHFSIVNPIIEPELFPKTWIILATVVFATAGVGLVIYFKKRNHVENTKNSNRSVFHIVL